jgi:manganese transport protein
VAEIESAYHSLTPLLGAAAAIIFLLALIASGISSSVVGTMAGQMIMQGFVHFQTPLWLRRAVTIIPSFVVVGCGLNVTKALVISQVVLSLALPFPMMALVWFAGRSDVVGAYRANLWLRIGAGVCATAVLGLNFVLVYQSI